MGVISLCPALCKGARMRRGDRLNAGPDVCGRTLWSVMASAGGMVETVLT